MTKLCLDLIENSKSIIVDRDPRDIYSSLLSSEKEYFSEFENASSVELLKSTSNFYNMKNSSVVIFY